MKQNEMHAAQANFADLERAISQLAEHVEHLRAEQQTEEKDLLAMDHESRKIAEEFERIKATLSHARAELEQLSRDGIELERNLERDREALTSSELTKGEQEQALESAREQLSAFGSGSGARDGRACQLARGCSEP